MFGATSRRNEDRELVAAVNAASENIAKWLAAIVEAIEKNKPEAAQQRGILMSRYRVPADAPDAVYTLVGNTFTDSEGNATGAGDVDLSLEITGSAVTATIGPQTLSADGNEVSAEVTLHFESPQVDQAVVNEKATNRDTGVVIAARSNEYVVGPGEATIGTLTGNIPLTPEPNQD